MKIAILSGKGGTGKTLLSVNLAAVAEKAKYLDCDVEEPNGHLFFKPTGIKTREVTVKIPVVNEAHCNGCRVCVDFCKFNALAYAGKLIIFEDICHSCGGCTYLCPEDALMEKDVPIGRIEMGKSENVTIASGILNIGVPSGVPIISDLLKEEAGEEEVIIIDCPPGSACIVMESIQDADYCILVAEPTIFGVHNLAMVHELVKLFEKPHGVVLNKCLEGLNPAAEYANQNGLEILGSIPFDYELGKLNGDGKIAAREREQYKELFAGILNKVAKEVHHEANTHS